MIELTSKASGKKILVNPDKIVAVYHYHLKGHESDLIVDCSNNYSFQVTESYEQVRSMLFRVSGIISTLQQVIRDGIQKVNNLTDI